MEKIEEWRPVVDWPEYEVSSHGRVKRITDTMGINPKNGKPMIKRRGGKIISLRSLRAGTHRLTLCARGIRRDQSIYVLVCQAFHGEKPSPRHEVAHWDGNRLNNHADNLRWATRKENSQDTIRHGNSNRGKKNVNNILDEAQVKQIREMLADGVFLRVVAEKFGVKIGTVYNIKAKRSWAWLE